MPANQTDMRFQDRVSPPLKMRLAESSEARMKLQDPYGKARAGYLIMGIIHLDGIWCNERLALRIAYIVIVQELTRLELQSVNAVGQGSWHGSLESTWSNR